MASPAAAHTASKRRRGIPTYSYATRLLSQAANPTSAVEITLCIGGMLHRFGLDIHLASVYASFLVSCFSESAGSLGHIAKGIVMATPIATDVRVEADPKSEAPHAHGLKPGLHAGLERR